jgi:hypothetical protein
MGILIHLIDPEIHIGRKPTGTLWVEKTAEFVRLNSHGYCKRLSGSFTLLGQFARAPNLVNLQTSVTYTKVGDSWQSVSHKAQARKLRAGSEFLCVEASKDLIRSALHFHWSTLIIVTWVTPNHCNAFESQTPPGRTQKPRWISPRRWRLLSSRLFTEVVIAGVLEFKVLVALPSKVFLKLFPPSHGLEESLHSSNHLPTRERLGTHVNDQKPLL